MIAFIYQVIDIFVYVSVIENEIILCFLINYRSFNESSSNIEDELIIINSNHQYSESQKFERTVSLFTSVDLAKMEIFFFFGHFSNSKTSR